MNLNGIQPASLDAPLSLDELISGGTCFQIDANFDNIMDETHISDEDDNDDDDEDTERDGAAFDTNLISPWTKTFADLREQMVKIEDSLYKRIVSVGDVSAGKVPLQARVHVRYNAYWEGESAPFDSTYLRGSTFEFYSGGGNVLTGLDVAVATMCRGEQAQFLIGYKLLFGEMGCPPRVKPKADALFIIEVVSFNLVGDCAADEELCEEDRKKYAKVIDKVKQIHLKGLDFFGQAMYTQSARTFERAVAVLDMCSMANEQEELEQKAFLIKLYTNLAVCYLKLNKPKKTCLMCRSINRLTNNKPSCKALFQEGRALHMLGEYERAKAVLKRAYRMEPHNRDIANELNLLEKRFSTYKAEEKNLWTKALGVVCETALSENKESEQNDIFVKEMSNLIQSFKDNLAVQEFELPSNLTKDELEKIKDLVKNTDVTFKVAPSCSETLYSLVKTNTQTEAQNNDDAE